jgi:hypothetical protein
LWYNCTENTQSLAYEIAPFNIRLTIIQPNIEVGVLTTSITACPPLPVYSAELGNPAPLAREILSRLLTKSIPTDSSQPESLSLTNPEITTVNPVLPRQMLKSLVAETVHVLSSIGGIPNPPARLIVGYEGIASVKEKLRTVMEELEDFIGVSEQVDIHNAGVAGSSAAHHDSVGRDEDLDA